MPHIDVIDIKPELIIEKDLKQVKVRTVKHKRLKNRQ